MYRQVTVTIQTSKDGMRCHKRCPYYVDGQDAGHCYLKGDMDEPISWSGQTGKGRRSFTLANCPGTRGEWCLYAERLVGAKP